MELVRDNVSYFCGFFGCSIPVGTVLTPWAVFEDAANTEGGAANTGAANPEGGGGCAC